MNDIKRLPKWAQERIGDLERQRDVAVKTLNDFEDSQTVSPISYDASPCTGEQAGPVTKTRYIQSHNVDFKHAGINLTVQVLHNDKIELQWNAGDRLSGGDVAFIPESYQCAKLITKQNMRK